MNCRKMYTIWLKAKDILILEVLLNILKHTWSETLRIVRTCLISYSRIISMNIRAILSEVIMAQDTDSHVLPLQKIKSNFFTGWLQISVFYLIFYWFRFAFLVKTSQKIWNHTFSLYSWSYTRNRQIFPNILEKTYKI